MTDEKPSGLGPTGVIPSALRQALGDLVSLCADQRDIFPDDATALAVITDTINELYGCLEDGVFGQIAAAAEGESATAESGDAQ